MSAKRGVVTPDQRSPADGSVSTRLTARTTQEFIELLATDLQGRSDDDIRKELARHRVVTAWLMSEARSSVADVPTAVVKDFQRALAVVTDESSASPPVPPRLHELNEAELKVLGKVVKGLSNAEISAELGFSEKTVKNRLNGIRDKLGTGNRTRMAVLAVHWRLCPP